VLLSLPLLAMPARPMCHLAFDPLPLLTSVR
jgi:hypothetical protein